MWGLGSDEGFLSVWTLEGLQEVCGVNHPTRPHSPTEINVFFRPIRQFRHKNVCYAKLNFGLNYQD